jgi:hypothetical protein
LELVRAFEAMSVRLALILLSGYKGVPIFEFQSFCDIFWPTLRVPDLDGLLRLLHLMFSWSYDVLE